MSVPAVVLGAVVTFGLGMAVGESRQKHLNYRTAEHRQVDLVQSHTFFASAAPSVLGASGLVAISSWSVVVLFRKPLGRALLNLEENREAVRKVRRAEQTLMRQALSAESKAALKSEVAATKLVNRTRKTLSKVLDAESIAGAMRQAILQIHRRRVQDIRDQYEMFKVVFLHINQSALLTAKEKLELYLLLFKPDKTGSA